MNENQKVEHCAAKDQCNLNKAVSANSEDIRTLTSELRRIYCELKDCISSLMQRIELKLEELESSQEILDRELESTRQVHRESLEVQKQSNDISRSVTAELVGVVKDQAMRISASDRARSNHDTKHSAETEQTRREMLKSWAKVATALITSGLLGAWFQKIFG